MNGTTMNSTATDTKPTTRLSLDVLHIPQPCEADWSAMTNVDGERVKYCTHCCKNVFNLSALPREAAERFVHSQLTHAADSTLCVRLYKRADGSIVSADRPARGHGVAARLAWGAAAVCSLLLAAVGCDRRDDGSPSPSVQPQIQAISGGITAMPPMPPTSQPVLLGRVSPPNR